MGKGRNTRRAFDQIEGSEGDSRREERLRTEKLASRNKRHCCLILLSIIVVGTMAFFSNSTTNKKGKEETHDQNKKDEPHLKELKDPENGQKPIKALLITGKNDNKYHVFRSYERGGMYYTQGFKHISGNKFLESAGLYKKSSIQYFTVKINEDTSELLTSVEEKEQKYIDGNFFAEGLDVFKDRNGEKVIYQLTWQERTILKYNMNLEEIGRMEIPTGIKEGWGLAVDDKDEKIGYVSDGSAFIYKVDTAVYKTDKDGNEKQSFKILEQIEIKDSNGVPVVKLNELEYVDGYLWANVYLEDRILKIDLASGKVVKDYDMSYVTERAQEFNVAMRGRRLSYGECLNGIAYNKEYKMFYVTGKDWPLIFEVEFL